MGRSCGRAPVRPYAVVGTIGETVRILLLFLFLQPCTRHSSQTFPFSLDLFFPSNIQHFTQLTTFLDRSPRSSSYPLKKIQENNTAEIMQTVLEEARASYAPEIVVELTSEGTEDLESNVARIVAWIEAWRRDRGVVEES